MRIVGSVIAVWGLSLCLAAASGAAAVPATPEAAVAAYFRALARGDRAAMKALSGPKMTKNLPQPGTPAEWFMRHWAAAFRSTAKAEVTGTTAVVVARFDPKAVRQALAWFTRFEAMALPEPRRTARLARYKREMPRLVKALSSLRLKLTRTGRGWIVTDFNLPSH